MDRRPPGRRPTNWSRAVALAYESLDLSIDDDQSLYVLLPADETSANALDQLVGRRPGGLRSLAS